jgi:segregation and condensation protein A
MTLVLNPTQQQGPEGRLFFGHPVKLSIFEGPLDLLLFLIRREEMDIYNIPIATITEQYLDYLTLLDNLDMDMAGDFLVMAAALMEIKSRSLLPKPAIMENDEEDSDPRAELISRLLEYRRYKDAAGTLDKMAEDNRFVITRPVINADGNGNGNGAIVLADEISVVHLWVAFQQVLSRAKDVVVGEVLKPRFTVAMKITELSSRLLHAPDGLSFFSLFPENVTKLEVIITFLALLELIRLGRVHISQTQAFGDIKVYGKAREQNFPTAATATAAIQ